MGPFLVTAADVPDPQDLEIETRVNGVTVQHSNTANMVFTVAALVSQLSAVMTLEPGDIIATGTPGGVGAAQNPPLFLHDGDIVEVEIERLGLPAQPRGGRAGGAVIVTQPLVDLTGRHVVITGGAGGVGQALAATFADANARISLLDLAGTDTKSVAAKVNDSGGAAAARDCDVSDPEQVAEAFAWAEDTFGQPDILVNNAGINKRGPSLEITGAEWDQTFAVNLTGYFQCAQQLGRGLADGGPARLDRQRQLHRRRQLAGPRQLLVRDHQGRRQPADP